MTVIQCLDAQKAKQAETLAAKVLSQDVGDPGHVGLLLRGVLGADEAVRTKGGLELQT